MVNGIMWSTVLEAVFSVWTIIHVKMMVYVSSMLLLMTTPVIVLATTLEIYAKVHTPVAVFNLRLNNNIDCNYECGEGEVPSVSCNGSCVIVDICVATSPCQNGGRCIIIYDCSYRCSCPLFYTGYNCEGFAT